jgi:hypothetical protein
VAARSASAGSASSDEESASNTAGSHDDGDDQLASMDSSSDPSAIVRLQVVKDVSAEGGACAPFVSAILPDN